MNEGGSLGKVPAKAEVALNMNDSEAILSSKGGLFAHLDMETVTLTPERVVIRMPVGPKVHQPFGLLHGGATVALCETAASVASVFHVAEGEMPVGLEINTNHLRPKASGYIEATATPVHLGRRTLVWDIRVHDEAGRLVAISRCTVARVPKP